MAAGEAPETPRLLFDLYNELRASGGIRAQYDALAKRVRAAKAAWTKLGDRVQRQQLADLQNYIAQFKPREESTLLTPESLERELGLVRRQKQPEAALRALQKRLEDTRAQRTAADPNHDCDHDDLTDGEAALADLAFQLGIDLSGD